MPGGRPPSDEKQRFLEKVKVVETGCHEWNAGIARTGYGKFYFRGRVSMGAHRAAYELFVGRVPKGKHVLHKCDNRKCVNPKHLFIGTHQDNVADMDKKGRRAIKTKFTAADAQEILLMLQDRYSQEYIAKKFGVDQTTISRVKLGKISRFKEN